MLLDVQNLKKTYTRGPQKIEALREVSFGLEKGQFTAVMGPSGSGKSTLLHLIGGLDRPTGGLVEFAGQNIAGLGDKELSTFRRLRLGFIFQFFNLLPTLNALENVCLPLLLDGQKMSQIQKRALEILKTMGLQNRAEHRPDQLSGGEMQRVAIARALISEPYLILADEPTGNLDSKTGHLVLEILKDLSLNHGQTILMVTHDSQASSFAQRLIKMQDGSIESDTHG